MKNTLLHTLIVLCFCCLAPNAASAKVAHVLPMPQKVEVCKGAGFNLGRDVMLSDNWSHSELLRDILTDALGCRIVPNAKAQVVVKQVERIESSDEPRLEAFEPEA